VDSHPARPTPALKPVSEMAARATVTQVPAPSLPANKSTLPDFRLNGIIYTVGSPSAILNGKMVYVGDHVSGATVLSIGQTNVTLLLNGLHRTFSLH
jgi:hypothetical protein